MKQLIAITVGFLHDFAAGGWAASGFAIYWLDRHPCGPEAAAALSGLKREFFLAGLFCILLVMATGVGRSFTYVDNVYGVTSEQRRRRLLIIKHLFLLTVFGLGTWWQFVTTFQ